MRTSLCWGIGILLLLWTTFGYAEEQESGELGKDAFLHHCAVCHGNDGKGKGPIADTLKYLPSDLTQLSKNNNGEFPRQRVYNAIDGRGEVRSHGPRDMPVWGVYYREGDSATGGPLGEGYARGNMMALTQYLESIQEK